MRWFLAGMCFGAGLIFPVHAWTTADLKDQLYARDQLLRDKFEQEGAWAARLETCRKLLLKEIERNGVDFSGEGP